MKPPRETEPRSSLLPLACLTAVVGVLLLVRLPAHPAMDHWPELMRQAENLGHPLGFGLLAHLAFRLLRARQAAPSCRPYLAVLAAAVVFGLATEAIQRLVDRDSSWMDLANDVLGAGGVLLFHARQEFRLRALATAAAALVILLAIGPFLRTVVAYVHRSAQMPVVWLPDDALFGQFSSGTKEEPAGLVVDEPFPDWSGYRQLVVELQNLRDVASTVTIRVHDRRHDSSYADRYNATFRLAAGESRDLRIPLEEIRLAPRGRAMDLTAIRGIVVFQRDRGSTPSFRVAAIRLER